VPTIDGTWTRPSDGVLFAPDRKETPELPVGLPLAIAGLPEIEGLPGLFQRAGVKPWSWRDLLLEQVLPLLSEVDTPMEARAAAWKTVGFYLDAEGGGDQTLARRFGRVLLPARRPGEQNWELRRADSLYFGKDWTGSSRLEAIFGSFGRQEFLAFPAPSADPDELSRLRRLFRWMGVESRPRILEATADTASEYMFSALDRHPHRRAAAALWDRWLASTDFSSARFCDQGHAGSDRQQLAASFTLDRFPQLIEEGSPTAMGALFASLVEEWGAYYEARTTAEIRCQHKSHTGERTRPVTSLFKYMLRELAWLPAVHRGGPVLSRPSDVWLVADDTPSSVQSVLPLLDEGLDQPEAAALLRTIGVVDGGRPRPSELAEALRQARDSFERGLGDTSRSACDAARWLMRHLDDALRRYGAGLGSDAEVPLLAKLSGESIFHMKPYYCDDQAIVDAWGDELPILDADQKLTSLRDGLGLPNLADEVGTEIAYRSPVEQLTQSLERHLHDAKPFIAALALATSPSREPEILSRLPRLSVIACHELQLIHRRGGQTRTTSVGARLREEVIRGRYRRSVGTIFVDDELAEALDWWTVGPLVAQHLLVPAVDDAISILLGQSVTEKGRFLRSKGIDEKAVRRAAELLDVGQDREDDRLSVIRRSFLEDLSLAIQNAADGVPDASEGPSQHSQEASDRGIESEEADTKPWRFNPTPVNEVQITPEAITDATPGATLDEAQRGRLSSVGGSPKSRDTRPPPDSELLAIGTWGEELVFLAEQSRVAEMGFSPDVVIWVAKDNPMSPYDLESIDVDGQRVIIEVKSTTDADPLSPFPISLGELRAMIDAREHAYLYRVTRAGTRDASIVRFRDPIGWWEDERAQIDVAGASMRFSATADSSADVLGSSQPDS
jgi:hypothetical protein